MQLKKVILYRVQEIIDLIFKKSEFNSRQYILENTELLLIGEGSKIEAGSYVTKNVEPNSTMFGVPAKRLTLSNLRAMRN